MLNVVRSIFPRWNFFDQVPHQIHVEYRLGAQAPWSELSFEARRTRLSLFFNPVITRQHAEISLLERFAQELPEPSPDSVRQVRALVQSRLTHAQPERPLDFTWRLSVSRNSVREIVFE